MFFGASCLSEFEDRKCGRRTLGRHAHGQGVRTRMNDACGH